MSVLTPKADIGVGPLSWHRKHTQALSGKYISC